MELHSLYFSTNTVRAINSCGMNGWGMQHTWERQEVLAEFYSEYLKGIDHLIDLGIDGRIL
jgi:hypothetical protein